MSDAVARPRPVRGTRADPRTQLDTAVIAPRPTRRRRAIAFQAFVLGATALFVVLAVVAHFVAYFAIDLTITRVVQSNHGEGFDRLMFVTSWIGFFPQAAVFAAIAIVALYFAGLRWEAVAALFAAAGIGVGALVKLVVFRPRPSADLVQVFAELPSSGFPSGHVLATAAFCGFLGFLGFTLLKPSSGRTAILVLLSVVIALMGPSRIYLGQHWFSDVIGAYLLGSLWLALTIRFYLWGKTRYHVHQPVAPAAPAASDAGTG